MSDQKGERTMIAMSKLLLRKLFSGLLAGLVVLALGACSGAGSESDEAVEASSDEEAAAPTATDESADSEGDANLVDNQIENSDSQDEGDAQEATTDEAPAEAGNEIPDQGFDAKTAAGAEEQPAQAAPTNVPTNTPAEPAPAPLQNAAVAAPVAAPVAEGAQGRVVRYVKADTQVHAEASLNSPAVGQLKTGDVIVVKINGEWAEIGAGRFVSNSDLSASIVTAKRSEQTWVAP